MNALAIIPARSGSKGLKDKNILELNGKPLLAYSIEVAVNSGVFEEVMVSTDSRKYAEIAKQYGASVPFLRSEETSSDTAGSWDVVLEVLDGYQRQEKRFDSVCLLQPTSPMRTADDIVNAYRLFVDENVDAVTSVCEVDHSPLWTMTLDETKSLRKFRENIQDIPRQNLDRYYRLNGAIYIKKVQYVCERPVLLNYNELAYIMGKNRSADIDTIDDFNYVQYLLSIN